MRITLTSHKDPSGVGRGSLVHFPGMNKTFDKGHDAKVVNRFRGQIREKCLQDKKRRSTWKWKNGQNGNGTTRHFYSIQAIKLAPRARPRCGGTCYNLAGLEQRTRKIYLKGIKWWIQTGLIRLAMLAGSMQSEAICREIEIIQGRMEITTSPNSWLSIFTHKVRYRNWKRVGPQKCIFHFLIKLYSNFFNLFEEKLTIYKTSPTCFCCICCIWIMYQYLAKTIFKTFDFLSFLRRLFYALTASDLFLILFPHTPISDSESSTKYWTQLNSRFSKSQLPSSR